MGDLSVGKKVVNRAFGQIFAAMTTREFLRTAFHICPISVLVAIVLTPHTASHTQRWARCCMHHSRCRLRRPPLGRRRHTYGRARRGTGASVRASSRSGARRATKARVCGLPMPGRGRGPPSRSKASRHLRPRRNRSSFYASRTRSRWSPTTSPESGASSRPLTCPSSSRRQP